MLRETLRKTRVESGILEEGLAKVIDQWIGCVCGNNRRDARVEQKGIRGCPIRLYEAGASAVWSSGRRSSFGSLRKFVASRSGSCDGLSPVINYIGEVLHEMELLRARHSLSSSRGSLYNPSKFYCYVRTSVCSLSTYNTGSVRLTSRSML